MPHRMIVLSALLALAGCSAPTRTVETQTAVTIPGPIQWREIPADLLVCPDRPELLKDGITGGQLRAGALGWQAYGICLESKLQAIGVLGQAPPP